MEISDYIEKTVEELEAKISEQEDEFLDFFINEYLSDFYVDDTTLKDSSGNFDKINQINGKFDEAYELFIVPFLLWFGKKLTDGQKMQVDYFKSIGVDAKVKDIDFLWKQIGFHNGEIVKNSYLWNLGKMGEVRQKFQDSVIKAVYSKQKYNVFLRNMKPIFKSNKANRSVVAKYYLKYAYDSVSKVINATGLYLANKYGLDKFVYDGGIIKDTRDFCRERAGGTFTRKDAEKWNQMHWSGKIEGEDVLLVAGGYKCLHHIKWIS